MTVQNVVGFLLLALVGYAWYSEFRRRRQAEINTELAFRRMTLNATGAKLDENKVAYEKAKAEFHDSAIQPDMFEHLGKPLPSLRAAAHSHDDSRGPGETESTH